MIFIDSNIWCYYFSAKAKENNSVAKYFDSALENETIAMNTVVVLEIAHYLIKGLGPVTGKQKIDTLLSYSFIIDEIDFATLKESLALLAEHSHMGIGGRDATILASMKKLGIKKLVTHDKAFQKISNIEVVDPVK